jgi:hypothetical protein
MLPSFMHVENLDQIYGLPLNIIPMSALLKAATAIEADTLRYMKRARRAEEVGFPAQCSPSDKRTSCLGAPCGRLNFLCIPKPNH